MGNVILAAITSANHPQGHVLGVVLTTGTIYTLGERIPVPYLNDLGVDQRRHLGEKHVAAIPEARRVPHALEGMSHRQRLSNTGMTSKFA